MTSFHFVILMLFLLSLVRFDPWDTLLDDAPLELTLARALDNQRFLLDGPFSRAWYLGERVASQYFPRTEAL